VGRIALAGKKFYITIREEKKNHAWADVMPAIKQQQ
jgi:hypothetical protein